LGILTRRTQARPRGSQRVTSAASQYRATGFQVASKARLKGGRRLQKWRLEGSEMTMWTHAVLSWTSARLASRVAMGVKKPPSAAEKRPMRAEVARPWATRQKKPRK